MLRVSLLERLLLATIPVVREAVRGVVLAVRLPGGGAVRTVGRGVDAAVALHEQRVVQHALLLLLLGLGDRIQCLVVDPVLIDLLRDALHELLHRSLQTLEEGAQVRGPMHGHGLIVDRQEQLPDAYGPPLHVLRLERRPLESRSATVVLLHRLDQGLLAPLHVPKDVALGAASRVIKRDALRVPLEGVQVLTQGLEAHLGVLDRALELLVLHVPVQELVHNVHHIREAGDLADLLEAVLGVLRALYLLKGNLLQRVPAQLLDRIELP
mmetsp:Transcript_115290/g.333046  ORF Transcript_115290/g.333046 Transcript_115290/m.333046 type:complete len:268 (-) Transcript_115290:838-1641(-)